MSLNTLSDPFDSRAPEASFYLSLEAEEALTIPYGENPNITLTIQGSLQEGIEYPQAALLINEDNSLWLTNLGEQGSIQVFRLRNGQFRYLDHKQVAYLAEGDLVSLKGHHFKIHFQDHQLLMEPTCFESTQSLL
ncbi:MAG: hypothetical protein KDK66_05990 [Deltaproteobacteria bacterium]|nr:hypothetical protein [Deltaproteobacteria bacterium]